MLKIRLQRVGRKNQASFRIVIAEKARSASKKVHEVLGFYDPRTKQFGIKDPERLQYWIGQHVEISPTMNNLLIDKKLLQGEKIKSWKPKKQTQTAPSTSSGSTPAAKAVADEVPEVKAQEAPKEAPKIDTPQTT